jgi:ATP-dependent RNA helicase DeaD
MMEWKDVIAKAPTGTGKTFAYGIPIVEHIDPEDETVQAVMLWPPPGSWPSRSPTSCARSLCAIKPGVRLVCLYGGQPIGKQIDALKSGPRSWWPRRAASATT